MLKAPERLGVQNAITIALKARTNVRFLLRDIAARVTAFRGEWRKPRVLALLEPFPDCAMACLHREQRSLLHRTGSISRQEPAIQRTASHPDNGSLIIVG
jgi:hypothetical protein